MASTLKTKGIILKIKDTPGKDKLLFILTEHGLLKAFMTPKKMAGKKSYTVDLFTYAEIVYFAADSGNNLVNSVTPIEYFYSIREDIASLYAAGYFASVAIYTAEDVQTDSAELFRLLYNAFLYLSRGANVKLIKSAYELRTAALLGMAPCLEAERKSDTYYFSMDDGRLFDMPVPNSVYLARKTVMSVYKILTGDIGNIFETECDDTDTLSLLAEQYFLYHSERNFDTLKFLNGVI